MRGLMILYMHSSGSVFGSRSGGNQPYAGVQNEGNLEPED